MGDTLIVFDLDGVITSEENYWDAAGMVVHEVLHGAESPSPTRLDDTAAPIRATSRSALPQAEIIALKSRQINNNWDVCHVAVCRRIVALLGELSLPDRLSMVPLMPWEPSWLARLRAMTGGATRPPFSLDLLHSPMLSGATGFDLLDGLDAAAAERLGIPVTGVFTREGRWWTVLQSNFQRWAGRGHERLIVAPEVIRLALQTLRDRGYRLGIATGRPRAEMDAPLRDHDLLQFFDPGHLACDDDVAGAGSPIPLAKPHPFLFRRAVLGSVEAALGGSPCPPFLVVGDSTSDIAGGRAAGGVTIAVLTGALTDEARAMLADAAPDITVADVSEVAAAVAHVDDLMTIQRLQFSDRDRAERFARLWFHRNMDILADDVRLRAHVVSLNSFNGTMRVGSDALFFKTHVEDHGIVTEYYNAETLRLAGYNAVQPLRLEQREGRQMAIYPVVEWPLMFDLMRSVETGGSAEAGAEALVAAEHRDCVRLLDIYRASMERTSAEEHALAPIHQLFWHRITGGRFAAFYDGAALPMPDGGGAPVPMRVLLDEIWVINGVEQPAPLRALLDRARTALRPARDMLTVVGHGDAHFGNVFLEDHRRYLYFDPAFGGRHSPLLDMAKPLFHNVYASWMYFPEEVGAALRINVERRGGMVHVTVDDALHPLRQAILDTRVQHLVLPVVEWLRRESALPDDWEEILSLALMCCPLLTKNLLDPAMFPAAIGWLGLTWAVRMGNRAPLLGPTAPRRSS